MKKIIAGIVLTIFILAFATVAMAYKNDKPKKAKTEQCCDKKDCQKTDCKKDCASGCIPEKPCK
jgi:hypothetical protein